MTKQDAKTIKEWRQSGQSWRKISVLSAEKWPDEGYCSDHQEEGMGLCDEATKVLGESIYSHPWG